MNRYTPYKDFASVANDLVPADGGEESLVIDARSGLSPSQMVERRLMSMTQGGVTVDRGNGTRRIPS